MDINEAALKLVKIEIIRSQVEHLQREAARNDFADSSYSEDCNEKAQALIEMLNVTSLFQ